MAPSATSPNSIRIVPVPNPNWTFGQGSNHLDKSSSTSSSSSTPDPNDKSHHHHTLIDPQSPSRPPGLNYQLLISAITPRPIAFLSTLSPDGTTANLAPFSYFNLFTHDPPTFVVGFAHPSSGGPRDSFVNIRDSRECVINIISEHYIEAANATSIDAPYGVSEWGVAGLTAEYSCETVKAPRVKEAVFSVEAKLESIKEIESRAQPGRISTWLVVLEGTRFWVRDDALSEKQDYVAPEVLRPIGRMGGTIYSKTTELMQLPRPQFEADLGGIEGYEKLSNGKK
ncbi:hypothetical protein HDV57DRAFT_515992 [Trichoderma longibrachiatum]